MARAAAISIFACCLPRVSSAQQLMEQLSAHVQKEEGVLVPLLQDSRKAT